LAKPATKDKEQAANTAKGPGFGSWLPLTGGRVTPITYGKTKPEEGGGTLAWRFLRVRDFEDLPSKSVGNLPKGIVEVRSGHSGTRFTGGHLMAAAFGGPDKNVKNLTILTPNGSKQLKAFEKSITGGFRLLLDAYAALCDMGLPPQDASLTVMIKVKTKGEWDKELPDKIISTHLTCKVDLAGQSDVDAAIKAMSPPPSAKLVAEYEGLIGQAEIRFKTARKTIDNR
jgi:hypothetical protein